MKKERRFKSRLRRRYRVIELGSACVSRAGEAVSGSRTFRARARDENARRHDMMKCQGRFGATPKPTRETRALPQNRGDALRLFSTSALRSAQRNGYRIG